MLINPQQSLEEVFNKIVNELEKGSWDKEHPFQVFVFATVDTDFTMPSLRNVILRAFDPSTLSCWFYSDSRSKKITEIKNNKNVSMLFWNPEEQIQVRVRGNALLHQKNDTAKKKWNTVKGSGKKLYNTIIPPGEEIENPGEAFQWKEELNDEHFTAVQIDIYSIEVLQLDNVEHKRALFIKKNNSSWNKSWIAP